VEINRIFDLLNLDNDKRNKPNRNRIASILKLWGFENKTINTEAVKVKAWLRPKSGHDIAQEQIIQDDDLKNKVLSKYNFLGSSSDVTIAGKRVEMELNSELNTLSSTQVEIIQSVSLQRESMELNLEPKNHNLELNDKLELLEVELNLDLVTEELSSSSIQVPETFTSQDNANPTILEPELSSTSNAGSESVSPYWNLRT
jgi:hypothetical protein